MDANPRFRDRRFLGIGAAGAVRAKADRRVAPGSEARLKMVHHAGRPLPRLGLHSHTSYAVRHGPITPSTLLRSTTKLRRARKECDQSMSRRCRNSVRN